MITRIALILVAFISLLALGCDFVVTPADKEQKQDVVTPTQTDEAIPDEPQGTDEEQTEPSDEVAPSGSELATPEEAEQVDVSDKFWISDKGVLHNSLCRWYEKCSGKEWDGESEHTNCQTCGGTEPIIRKWNLPDYKEEK